jgi:hypothetical protein
LAVGEPHGGGDPAPKPDSTAGAAVAGGALTMTEPTIEASSSQTQSGAATPEIVPKVDTTTTTSAAGMTGSGVPEVLPTGNVASAGGGAATTGDSDGNKLEVVMGHLNL